MIVMVQEDKKDKKKETDFKSNLSDAYKDFDLEMGKIGEKDKKRRKEVIESGLERVEKKSEKELVSSKLLVNRILEIRKKSGLAQTIGTVGKIKTPILFGKDEFKQ